MNENQGMFALNQALDMDYGDVDNDGSDGTILEVSFYLNLDDAENGINPIGDTLEYSIGQSVFARVATIEGCYDIGEIDLVTASNHIEFQLEIDEVCSHEELVQLSGGMPAGGVYTVTGCITNSCNVLSPCCLADPIIEMDGNYFFDPSVGEATYIIEYAVDGETMQDIFSVHAVNAGFIPTQTISCGNSERSLIIANNSALITGQGVELSNGQYYFNPDGLDPGMYALKNVVEGSFGNVNEITYTCSDSMIVMVEVLGFPDISILANANPICEDSDLQLSLTIEDEMGDYTYKWTYDGDSISNERDLEVANITPEMSGLYGIIVTDENGCVDADSELILINELAEVTCVIDKNITCIGGSDGRAEVTVDVGAAPFIYLWNTSPPQNGSIATGLEAGDYEVTVTDNNGCESICMITLTDPEILEVSIDINAEIQCNGDGNGMLTAVASGGYGNYSFQWSHSDDAQSSNASNLFSGSYSVTVTDEEGCTASTSETLVDPPLLTCLATEMQSVTCYGGMDGIASVATVMPGNGAPYSYLWSNSETSSTNSNLSAGTYTVTVTDIDGCTTSCSVEITQPEDQPNAGDDAALEICNAAVPAILDLFTALGGDPTEGGIWNQTDGPEEIDVEDNVQSSASFECVMEGLYLFEYVVLNDIDECPNDTSVVEVEVIECFDLALKKTVSNFRKYEPGEDVRFDIEVHNQGEVDAYDVEITDYIQLGFIFEEEKNTPEMTGNVNPWVTMADDAVLEVGLIPALSQVSVSIILTIEEEFEGVRVDNFAEITNYSNGQKPFPPDEDDEDNYPEEIDDDIRDESNGSVDNPDDDDQYDGAFAPLCDVAVLACNNFIQLSFDENCEIVVDEDMVLEGSAFPCASDFRITIEGIDGNIITSPGTYGVTITSIGEIENHCWGIIKAEDKIGPELMCMDQSIPCSNSTFPGDEIIRSITDEGFSDDDEDPEMDLDDQIITGGEDSIAYWNFEINQEAGAVVKEIEVEMDIDHEKIDELKTYLINPQNDTFELFLNIQDENDDPNCLKQGMLVSFEDDAPNSYTDLKELATACRPLQSPSIVGAFQPKDSLSMGIDSIANGLWRLCMVDCLPEENNGQINSASLILSTAGERIKFPINSSDAEFTAIDEHTFEITGLSICEAAEASFVDELVEECEEGSIGHIKRIWTVTDHSGNSSMCTQWINIEKGELDDIVWPENFDDHDRPSFKCCTDFPEEYLLDNGAPSPEVTGEPYLNGHPLKSVCRNIQLTYSDVVIPVCGKSIKVVRNWLAVDWCVGKESIVEHFQVIKIIDDLEPICTVTFADFTEVPIDDEFNCKATFVVPSPKVIFECNPYIWKIEYLIGAEANPDGTCPDPEDVEGFTTENAVYSNGLDLCRCCCS